MVRLHFSKLFFFLMSRPHPTSTLFPYTTLFRSRTCGHRRAGGRPGVRRPCRPGGPRRARSEEHTSELQSHSDLVCRLLLEKKNHFLIVQMHFSKLFLIFKAVVNHSSR